MTRRTHRHDRLTRLATISALLAGLLPLRADALPPEIVCLDPVIEADASSCSACPDLAPDGPVYEAFDPTGGEVACAVEPGCPFGLGVSPLAIACADADGAISTAACSVEVVAPSPTLEVVPLPPRVLWPPDHRYASVSVASCIERVEVRSPGCGAPVPVDPSLLDFSIVRITSSEPEDDARGLGAALGDGSTCNDMVIVDPSTALLRRERSGRGRGRVYHVHFRVRYDLGDLSADGQCTITVPHGRREPAVDRECRACVGTGCESCVAPAPACDG